ncbi:zinc-binding dehydrogenase [Kineosporia succinea]|uniref:D-arabinose 1-dehydrogenase-like Zn-dependent alcohol dehydrogenase n=1 Tax=Kineosporia succinea TaxID=84632 RepID=A0ABT9PE84_9ACTN|nr:zinc-binding dehydrogenase [Kineosporia succinea]MDP9831026.1 D-arabinose 1-dehydrogenase-like Zn-dependent alcohol dehydrogenase [Kineosporia succinea]
MLAGRLNITTGVFGVEEIPEPHAGPGQVRIAVRAAGVCLSDVHVIQGMLKPAALREGSVTMGHETAGVIDEVGPGVEHLRAGQRVLLLAGELMGDRIVTRGVDYDGGWAQYAVATAGTVVPIPDSLPFEQACFVPDAVSTPWAAISSTAGVQPARAAGVWGIGGLGVHAVQLLRLVGAAPVIAVDPLPAARSRALAFGADLALDPRAEDFNARVQEATGGLGLAYAFDFAGAGVVREQAVRVLGVGGLLVLIGLSDEPLTIPSATIFTYFQQQVRGHYGSRPEHIHELLALIAAGRLDLSRSVSDVLPLSEAVEAVHRLDTKKGDPVRLVLTP